MGFLEKYELNKIPLTLQVGELKPINLFLGEGSQPLEIAVLSSSKTFGETSVFPFTIITS